MNSVESAATIGESSHVDAAASLAPVKGAVTDPTNSIVASGVVSGASDAEVDDRAASARAEQGAVRGLMVSVELFLVAVCFLVLGFLYAGDDVESNHIVGIVFIVGAVVVVLVIFAWVIIVGPRRVWHVIVSVSSDDM